MDIQVKLKGFSGDQKDWDRWNITFLAKARLRGYRSVILGLEDAPNKGSKGYEEFLVKNDNAFSDLLICSESDVCLGVLSIKAEQMSCLKVMQD